jgi:two-component system phosphate regulon sensor histidine kinase PhoR
MFASQLPIRLPRRVTAYFLFFGLAALVWLSVGAVYVARSVTDSSSESASLRSLGRGSDRLVLAYLRDKTIDLGAVLSEIRAQSGASFCAIVSPTGELLAHTGGEVTGRPATERGQMTDRWGEVVRVQYQDDHGVSVHEYRTPLKAGDTDLGTLQLGIAQPSIWTYLGASAQFAPLAFIGPACFMAVGAVLVNRLVRPVAEIEGQLFHVATSPSVEGCELREVPSYGAAALGWNRVVRQRLNAPKAESLRERIRQSLEHGRHSRLDALLNSIPDGVATTDAEGRLTYTNVPMAVIIGLPEAVGSSGDSFADDAAPRITDQFVLHWNLPDTDALLAEENRDRPVITELTRDENGQRRVVRVARHPVCIAGGSHHETHVWLVRDVTQQKLAEEMRDQFVDTATHELRTPLANIKAYAETLALADVIDVEQQKQFLNTINSEATRLARFVDDLLSVSSMEVGSLSLNKQVTDLGRMLNEVLAKIRPQVDEKQLALEVVLPEKLPEPELDKDKMAAVLVNLLGNAVKYTPEGGRIAFRVNVTDQHLEISIEDTGVGIAHDELGKVFDKFFRSSDPRVQEQTGTGLGLALAQEVVRLHGGRIDVESEINKGSTFSVTLPVS